MEPTTRPSQPPPADVHLPGPAQAGGPGGGSGGQEEWGLQLASQASSSQAKTLPQCSFQKLSFYGVRVKYKVPINRLEPL